VPGQHYRTRNTLKALFVNRRSFKPKSQSPRSILILDEKSVIRHLAVSSLPMDVLMESVSMTLNLLRETGPVTLGEQGRKSSFLDKLWRTNLKLPETPQTSLKRSVSREVRIISICFKVA